MARSIMIQGTMSNVGKSLITAGLCRIFAQDGYRVAPFKSQNMALNSFITKEGLEMGRAQVMQAEAAGIEPTVRMNPILLKPTSDTGSQVIVNGEVVKDMTAREYFSHKTKLVPEIMKAYESLDQDYDIIVIEGAGSPAEINLKNDDIVNMGMAKMADAPVLLVGDIDRGGVFAQLAGTMLLLDEEEQNRVKGFIINKFRGDKSILDPGLEQFYEKVPIPVLGVTPYMNIHLEDEDSLSDVFTKKEQRGELDIVVIRLPHISNFTDFYILEGREFVTVRYVEHSLELEGADLIIIPGSKNTIGDMEWIRTSGMESGIKKAVSKNVPVFGICGGYQIMGTRIYDPLHVESGGSIMGLGLLPVETEFGNQKRRTRVKGRFGNVSGVFHSLSGLEIEGYEIHMGTSRPCEAGLRPLGLIMDMQSGEVMEEGCFNGNCYGTYLHGIFDGEGIADALFEALAYEKGIEIKVSSLEKRDYALYKEAQYNHLAKTLREHLDLDAIYDVMGLNYKKTTKYLNKRID